MACVFTDHAISDSDVMLEDSKTRSLPTGSSITLDDVRMVQKRWADAVVAIGAANPVHAPDLAATLSRELYAFEVGPIQFKPTLAADRPFRVDLEGTVSYFIGNNDSYPEDQGFALRPWLKIRFNNHLVKLLGNVAIVMGHYYYTGTSGPELKVEFTKGYIKLESGETKLFLQHSSLPFQRP